MKYSVIITQGGAHCMLAGTFNQPNMTKLPIFKTFSKPKKLKWYFMQKKLKHNVFLLNWPPVPKNKRHAQPDPTFGVPDGIYPASVGIPDGIYPAGVTSYSRALQPTGIYSAGGTTYSSHTLKPTGIFTTGVTTQSRPLRPTGIFATGGSTYNRPLRPTGIFTVG